MKNEPKTIRYKNHILRYCWCGYPEMAWMVYDLTDKWISVHKTIEQARHSIDEMEAK